MDIGVQLAHLREQASELYLLIDEESSDRVRAFDEEKISLESLIISLNQSQVSLSLSLTVTLSGSRCHISRCLALFLMD